MPNRILSARLAAKADIRQVEATVRADQAAEATARAIGSLWQDVLELLRTLKDTPWKVQPWAVRDSAAILFRAIAPHARFVIYTHLVKMASWGHRTAAENLAETLPLAYLRAAAASKLDRLLPTATKEAIFFDLKEAKDAYGLPSWPGVGFPANELVALVEDEPVTTEPGLIQLTATEFGLDWRDLAARIRGIGAVAGEEPASDQEATKAAFAKLLFRPISPERVNAIVFGVGGDTSQPWELRWARASKLAPPEQLAQTVANGYTAGKSPREIAKDLLPVVNNVRTSATRIARTECLRVSHQIQMEAHAQVDDLIAGYQMRAVLDEVTRPRHRLRNGLIWHKTDAESMPAALKIDGPFAPTLPDDYNCLLPGAEIQGEFTAAIKAYYAGKAIEFCCASDNRSLRITANHPIFTARGVIPAYQLTEGDQVFRYMGPVNDLSENKDDGPSLIEDVFRTIKQFSWPIAFRPALSHFDGDALYMKGDVEVVTAERPLPLDSYAQKQKRVANESLAGSAVGTLQVSRTGTCKLTRLGINPTSASYMRCLGLRLSNRFTSRLPFYFLSFGAAAKLDASRYEQASESDWMGGTASGDAKFIGQLLEGFARQVATDYVVKIRHFDFSGHVYDLHSMKGFIIANNIFISNCR